MGIVIGSVMEEQVRVPGDSTEGLTTLLLITSRLLEGAEETP